MRRLHYCVFAFLLLSLLSGCGFHLRKNAVHLNSQYPTIVLPFSGSHTFHLALRRALLAHSIRVVPQATCPDLPKLMIVSQLFSEQPIVYGPDNELRRERLLMTITFSFGYLSPKQFVLSTVRDHQLYSSQHLGDNAEKSLMETEMQADIIEQLLRYIESEQFN
jgi:outer membrane lipopolysaccharide assembly protein LptE/RlpB